jgi:predicted alpha/beta hydrolase
MDEPTSFRILAISTADGFTLGGRLYGDPVAAQAGVLIAPAMGVAQGYYADFAAWLARQGYAVLSFDYRGMGASRPAAFERSLRGLQADVVTWAECDAGAAVDHLGRELAAAGAPARRIHWLGHSLGGQILGLLPDAARLGAVVTVASGSGYWRENARRLRRSVWALWYFIAPLALALAGYFPGRRLRKVGDLPAGVMAQWRRWCLSPDYMMGEGGAPLRARYAQVRNPILSLSFTDDEFMSARNIESLHGFYAGAPREMRRIAPQDVGERAIGHFGFFRARFAGSLWPQVARFLATA